MAKRLKTAVLLSGSGTTLKNLIDRREKGEVPIDIDLVISSKPNAGGLKIAADAGIRTKVISPKNFTKPGREAETLNNWEAMSAELNKLLLPGGYDVICMAGYLSRYIIPDALFGKVLNIHPSLIPMFCGPDMYGMRVHQAVVDSGVKITGCTVHIANNEYDAGPIILQRSCPVYSHDTPEDVAKRVFAEECEAYPEALRLIAEDRLEIISNTRVFIKVN
jgi:phosphoribosylglycinamide formyltransferase, formyltetrahydrofolate-dependent